MWAPRAVAAVLLIGLPTVTDPRATATGPADACPTALVDGTDGVAWTDGPSTTMTELAPGVRAAVYPGPAASGNPWSQWGQGVLTADGHLLSAVGDHLGVDGNSYLYDFDPVAGRLTLIADVLAVTEHTPGDWGYGKIHAPLVAGPCGEVYAATYWGTRRGLRYTSGYRGDLLLRLDPAERTTTVLGVPVPGHGLPSMSGAGTTLFAEAPIPTSEPDAGAFVAYDLETGTTTVVDQSADHVGFRAIAVDADGRALFTKPAGRLTRYDPTSGDVETLPGRLPGRVLRAATIPAPDGTVYGVTDGPAHFVAIAADGSIDDLGPAPGYVTSMALTPDGSTAFFVPGAHGDSWQSGTAVHALDTATGDARRVVELNPLTEAGVGLTAGGTYNVVLDAERGHLYVGLNGARVADREETTFGQVVLVDIDLEEFGEAVTARAGAGPVAPGDCRAFAALSPAAAVGWENATEESGVARGLVGMMGHAAAWGDVDGDGLVDLAAGTFADRPAADYRVRGAKGPSTDQLLFGVGDGGFAGGSLPGESRGRTSGAVFADLDLDDDLDLVLARNVTGASTLPTQVLENDGGELSPVADSGLDPRSPGRSIGVLDVDADGLPDLVVLEDRWRGGRSRLYRNVGDLRFEDASVAWGWPADVHGLGAGTGDLDGDGRTDLVVGGSNRVFLGTGDGLREVPEAITPWAVNGDEDDPAGVALGDVDLDGDADVVIGQHYNSTVDADARAPVRLYLNDSEGPGDVVLQDITTRAGLIGLPTKAPHVALVDLDNDGWLDLLTSASAAGGTEPAVFWNAGDDGGRTPRFRAPSGLGADQYWVTAPTADVDGDGRLDVVLVEWEPGRSTQLLLNRFPSGHALEVAVDASLGGGPGTVVTAYEPGRAGAVDALVARVEISVSQGYSAGVEPVAHLGVGDRSAVDLVVTPPAPHAPITLEAVAVGRRLTLPTDC